MTPELHQMRLLIVDAEVDPGEMLERLLRGTGYADVVRAQDASAAALACAGKRPDLVLLDLDLPDGSVDQAFEQLRPLIAESEAVPVLVITAQRATGQRQRALSIGARDFVTRPVCEAELLLRVRNLLYTRQLQQQLKDRDALIGETVPKLLAQAVSKRTGELDNARRESLTVLASIAEYHDDDTYQHTQRVGACAAQIAHALDLPSQLVATIRDAAPLHDIGKVGISRRILLKPGQLTPAEWVHMTRHVEIGARILGSAQSPALAMAAEIARTHHERWDGNGYLAGLAGEEIPIAGRITAVADVFDVLTHERPYSRAWETDRALAEIYSQAGRQFDPRVVAAFATIDPQTLSEPLAAENAQRAA